MTFPVPFIKRFIESLEFSFLVKEVVDVQGGKKLVLRNSSTHYANIKNYVKINGGAYRVLEVVKNESITLETSQPFAPGVYNMAAPEFLHGTYEEAQMELAIRLTNDDPDKRRIMPLVYLIEPLNNLSQTSSPLSAFEWDGSVLMYLMNQTNWQDRPSEHYDNNLISLGAVIDAINRQYRAYFKVTESPELSHRSFPKFVTKSRELKGGGAEQVFSQSLSAIEFSMRTPILKCLTTKN